MHVLISLRLTLILSLLFFAHASRADDYKYAIDLMLLDSSNSLGIKLGARERYDLKDHSVETLDVVATKLWQIYKNPIHDPDTIAWLAKNLGASANPRYRPLLVEVHTNTVHRSARKHISNALNALNSENPSGYFNYQNPQLSTTPGLALAHTIINSTPDTHRSKEQLTQAFQSITTGDKLETVISKLGLPNASSSDLIVRDLPRIGKRKMQQLLLKYKDIGLVRLTKLEGSWQYIDTIPYPPVSGEFPHSPMQNYETATDIEFLDELWTWDIYQLQRFIHGTGKLQLSQAKLDLVAQRIWVGRADQDPFVVDALAHLCKIITRSRNPRYALIMEHVTDYAAERKLKKHANNAARMSRKLNRSANVEQLQPLN